MTDDFVSFSVNNITNFNNLTNIQTTNKENTLTAKHIRKFINKHIRNIN